MKLPGTTTGKQVGEKVNTARTRGGKIVKVKPDGTRVIRGPLNELKYRKAPKRPTGSPTEH